MGLRDRIKKLIRKARRRGEDLRQRGKRSLVCRCPRLFSHRSTLTAEEARQILTACSGKPGGSPDVQNLRTEPVCDLQIIVPAYNAEAYLEDCIGSILTQDTKYTYKVVLIDDGSTDSTPAIADRYRDDDRVVVIHQENAGFSGARNRGLQTLFGRYIMFVDSDDMLCPGAIDALLDTALAHDCGIVEGGAESLYRGQRKIHFSHPETRRLDTALGVFHGQPWAKVFKAEYFENLVFPEGYWFEDSIFSFLMYPVAEHVWTVGAPVYVYRLNPAGITATAAGRPKSVDTYWIVEMLMEERQQRGLPNDGAFFKKYLNQIVHNQKRLASMPEAVQESAFVLSCCLMKAHFSQAVIACCGDLPLARALVNRDWGIFRAWCGVC